MLRLIDISKPYFSWLRGRRKLPYGFTTEETARELGLYSLHLWRAAGRSVVDTTSLGRFLASTGRAVRWVMLGALTLNLVVMRVGMGTEPADATRVSNAVIFSLQAAVFILLGSRWLILRGKRLQFLDGPLGLSTSVVSQRRPIVGQLLFWYGSAMVRPHRTMLLVCLAMCGWAVLWEIIKLVVAPQSGSLAESAIVAGTFIGLLPGVLIAAVAFANGWDLIPGFGYLAPWAEKRGRALLQPTASELRAEDERTPVVLLRSFRDERLVLTDDVSIRDWRRLFGFHRRVRFEEALADSFSHYGPLIAIGKPGETLPMIGAARNYYSDGEWQATISDWIAQARLVVLVAGLTGGLRWELEAIRRSNQISKLLILMPPDSPTDRWRVLADELATYAGVFRVESTPPAGLSCIHVTAHGDLVMICGSGAKSSDYRTAINCALFGMFLAHQTETDRAGSGSAGVWNAGRS